MPDAEALYSCCVAYAEVQTLKTKRKKTIEMNMKQCFLKSTSKISFHVNTQTQVHTQFGVKTHNSLF